MLHGAPPRGPCHDARPPRDHLAVHRSHPVAISHATWLMAVFSMRRARARHGASRASNDPSKTAESEPRSSSPDASPTLAASRRIGARTAAPTSLSAHPRPARSRPCRSLRLALGGHVEGDERAREAEQVSEESGRRDLEAGARPLQHHGQLVVAARRDLDDDLVRVRVRGRVRVRVRVRFRVRSRR